MENYMLYTIYEVRLQNQVYWLISNFMELFILLQRNDIIDYVSQRQHRSPSYGFSLLGSYIHILFSVLHTKLFDVLAFD